jgi:hypothetical protein
VVTGTAVYTSTFTPPTTPLTVISGTSLLTCQSNRLIDKSTNNVTITKAGDAAVSPHIPFAASSSYSTYGSGYFDGTGDYLTTPITSSGPLDFGSGNWTVEAWVMYTGASLTGGYRNFLTFCNDSGLPYIQFGTKTSTGYVFAEEGTQSTVPWTVAGTTLLTSKVWHHIAAVRNSNNIYLYLDGVSQGSVAYSGTHQTFAKVQIGSLKYNGSIIQDWTGYIADVRIVKGTAVYTSAFTPPTTPLTAIANTSLLTCQYNGTVDNKGIIDNGPLNNIITRSGNTSQGTFSPYSQTGWSNYFDGTGDYLTTITSTGFGFGTGVFTFEAWVYPTSNPANGPGTLMDCRSGISAEGWVVRLFNNLTVGIYDGPNNKEILEEKRVENNHPFYYKDWVFVLHGDVFLLDKHDYYIFQRHHKEDMFKDFLLKIMGNILPKYRKMIKGKTDSELIFYLFLSMWENLSKDQKMDPKKGLYMCLLQVLDILQKSRVKYSFNFIIAKGKIILVNKSANCNTVLLENKINLFVDKSDGAIVVCSSKITGSSVKMGVNSSLFIEF